LGFISEINNIGRGLNIKNHKVLKGMCTINMMLAEKAQNSFHLNSLLGQSVLRVRNYRQNKNSKINVVAGKKCPYICDIYSK
jgi:hypothetical protein